MKKVTVAVHKDGKATIDVDGVVGGSCATIVEEISRALNARTVSDDKKPDFYVEQTVSVDVGG